MVYENYNKKEDVKKMEIKLNFWKKHEKKTEYNIKLDEFLESEN